MTRQMKGIARRWAAHLLLRALVLAFALLLLLTLMAWVERQELAAAATPSIERGTLETGPVWAESWVLRASEGT